MLPRLGAVRSGPHRSPSPSPIPPPLSLDLSLQVASGHFESPPSSTPPPPEPPLRMHARRLLQLPLHEHHYRHQHQIGTPGTAEMIGDEYYQGIEQALFLAYVPRLGRDSLISKVDHDILKMILRQECEVAPSHDRQMDSGEKGNCNPGSLSHPPSQVHTGRETLSDALHRWRLQSVRLILRLQRGEYKLQMPLQCKGNVCFESVDASHTHVLIHGTGSGAVIQAQPGAQVSLDRVSILQYAQHNGLDFVSTGSDMEPSLWPCCVLSGPGSHVCARNCFLHCRAGSGAVSSGARAFLSVISSEMHGCCFAGAAAFNGGHLHVRDARVQWCQFHGFCCTGPGSTMVIQGSSANDCGRHGVVAMKGATAEVSSCSSTRNGFAGCVSYGERSNLAVRHSNLLQNRHAGCGCYQGGCVLVSTCNLDNNIDAGLHVVGPASRATVERSNINNNRVSVFVQEDALVRVEESKIGHCIESGVVARGPRVSVCLSCCVLAFNQVHGCVAEEGACLRVETCRLEDNRRSAASSCDSGSRLILVGSSVTQSGRGVYIAYGANADAIDCSMVFNEETAVTVQDPGSRLVMERCNMARNVIAAYTTSWGSIEMFCCKVPPRGHLNCNATDYMVSDHGSIYSVRQLDVSMPCGRAATKAAPWQWACEREGIAVGLASIAPNHSALQSGEKGSDLSVSRY